MGAEIEVGKNSEGLTVIHVEPENNHLYYKLIVSNIKQECFA
jgi:rRNA maturation protein Rpf1